MQDGEVSVGEIKREKEEAGNRLKARVTPDVQLTDCLSGSYATEA